MILSSIGFREDYFGVVVKRPRPYPWLEGQTYPATANGLMASTNTQIVKFKANYAYENNVEPSDLEADLATFGGATDVSDTDSNDSDA